MVTRIGSLVSSLMGCLQRRRQAKRPCLLKTTAASLVLAVGVVVWVDAQHAAERDFLHAQADQFFLEISAWPVMDAVLSDHPEAELLLRRSILEDLKAGRILEDRFSETYDALWSLRNDYVFPSIRAAESNKVLDVWRTHAKALHYVGGKSTEQCVTFIDLGIAFAIPELNASRPEIQNFSKAVLEAYRNGKGAQEQEVLSTSDVLKIWETDLNFRDRHWEAITTPKEVPIASFCSTGIRMSTNLHLVEEGKRTDYARTIMGQRHM